MIHVEAVSFRYPASARDALHEFSLHVPQGSLFGLLGPNGSGKTTLVSLLTGLLKPNVGTVRIGSLTSSSASVQTPPRIALVPQEYAFYPRLNVMENLRFFAGMYRMEANGRTDRIDFALEAAGLEAFNNVRAQRLSGGLKRRLNLAIGLLNDPELLLLDEPTVGIDPQSRSFILESIRHANAAGTTVVYTSHYMEEVEALCTEIGVLDQGRLIAHGNLESLLRGNRDGELLIDLEAPPDASLTAALNQFPGLKIDGTAIRVSECRDEELKALLNCVTAAGVGIARMRYGQGNLETLFLHLTGRQLRD